MVNQDLPGTVWTQWDSRPAGGVGPKKRSTLPSAFALTVGSRLTTEGWGSSTSSRDRVWVS